MPADLRHISTDPAALTTLIAGPISFEPGVDAVAAHHPRLNSQSTILIAHDRLRRAAPRAQLRAPLEHLVQRVMSICS